MMRAIALYFLTIVFFSACSTQSEQIFVSLDTISFNEIIDPYGPPVRNQSFANDTLQIGDYRYQRGLGIHAPSHLYLDLRKKGIEFSAIVGVDFSAAMFLTPENRDSIGRWRANYVYDNLSDHYDFTLGSTVVFRVFGDDRLLWQSDTMNLYSTPDTVMVSVKGINTLLLVADPTNDGSYADYANWINPTISLKDSVNLQLYHYQESILVNHEGFTPSAAKSFKLQSHEDHDFKVVDAHSGKEVFQGVAAALQGDLGSYVSGSFTELDIPGTYYIVCNKKRSHPFVISDTVYDAIMDKHLKYYELQRSGHPEKGWAKNQHLDDGIRDDNKRYQDVTGGWYDASDIRKAAQGNVLMLYSLLEVLKTTTDTARINRIIEEAKWGNKFLLAMLEPDGKLMRYIGFTWEGIADNRWTDNVKHTGDERLIITRPAEFDMQLLFVTCQLDFASLLKKSDPHYAQICEDAAKLNYKWIQRNYPDNLTLDELCIDMLMNAKLFEYFNQQDAYNRLVGVFNRISSGMDYLADSNFIYPRDFINRRGQYNYDWLLFSLTTVYSKVNENLKAEMYRLIESIGDTYYVQSVKRNSFDLIPWFWFTNAEIKDQMIDTVSYKYFLHVGMNRHLGLEGAGLAKASVILQKPEYMAISQSQLDWIIGVNPYNTSTIVDVGFNQPVIFKTGATEFRPYTPELTGAVMTGIGGTKSDEICMYPGWWWTTEYWAPTISAVMLLLNEINQNTK